MTDEMSRYADFSDDEWIINAFDPNATSDPRLVYCGTEIQKYLAMRNPISAIKGLTALNAAYIAGLAIESSKSRTITNALLGGILALLGYIAFVLS